MIAQAYVSWAKLAEGRNLGDDPVCVKARFCRPYGVMVKMFPFWGLRRPGLKNDPVEIVLTTLAPESVLLLSWG